MKYFIKKSVSGLRVMIVFIATLLALSGCKEKTQPPVQTSKVLVTVNGEAITEEELDFTLESLFSANPLVPVTNDLREKVLDSLIASSAMKQAALAQMSEGDIAQIRAKVKKYEEELYVKEYLSSNAVPEPVTTAMVAEYYKNNQADYTTPVQKVFELLTPEQAPSEKDVEIFVREQKAITAADNWKALGDRGVEGLTLRYLKSKAAAGLLDDTLNLALKNLDVGDVSGIVYYQGKPTLLRVIGKEGGVQKPLAEVSSDIRKTLAPVQLRKAVKTLTDQVVGQATVVRDNANN